MSIESANMEPNQDRSIVPQPSRELAASPISANRILGEMVESTLAIVNEVTREAEFDALVKEAKRLQEGGAGNEMSPNNVRAFQLFLRAAEGGHVEAQYEVAECFGWGTGVAKDSEECDRWFRLAAEQGHVDAQSMLGMFRLGKSEESTKWLRKAAEQGDYGAQTMLGCRLAAGEGMKRDDCEGLAWIQLALDADQGDTWMQDQAVAIASSMTPAELEKTRELFQDYKRKYSTKG